MNNEKIVSKNPKVFHDYFVDETIQRFTQRSSQLTDVLIDTGGFLTGVLLVYFIVGVCALVRKHKGNFPRNSK